MYEAQHCCGLWYFGGAAEVGDIQLVQGRNILKSPLAKSKCWSLEGSAVMDAGRADAVLSTILG